MSNFLQEKKGIMFFLMIILFLLVGLGYMYKIKPLQDELTTSRMNVQGMEAEIQILNAQIAQANEEEKTEAETEEQNIENKLPTARYLDDILIQLAQVEKATNSKINSISFNTTEGTLSEADIQTMRTGYNLIHAQETEESTDEVADESVENGDPVATTEDAALNPPPAIPGVENIKYVTVNLSITSPNYTRLRQFLTEVENLERITRIDSFSFSDVNKKGKNGKALPITIGLQISTFYYTGN